MSSKQKNSYSLALVPLFLGTFVACASTQPKEATTQQAGLTTCTSEMPSRDPAAIKCIDSAKPDKKNKFEAEDGHVSIIATIASHPESPVVSPDGKKIVVINDIAGKAPDDAVIKDLTNPNDKGKKLRKWLGNLIIKASFTGKGDEVVACELGWRLSSLPKTLAHHRETGEWDPIGYHSMISFWKNRKRVSKFDAAEFGLPDKTFLQHPRVSPDGKWLTFYVQPGDEMPDASTQGLYVYNRQTRKTFYLGNFADKHPTWAADGQKIFFHEQGKMGKVEVARVGYYQLEISGDDVKVKSRNFFNDPGRELGSDFVYQKHPAFHSGLNMVFFHMRVGEGCAENPSACKKSIGAISLDHPDRAPIEIKLVYNGQKVSHAEHVDVSDQPNSPLYFVGRVDGEKEDRLLSVDFATLQRARDQATP